MLQLDQFCNSFVNFASESGCPSSSLSSPHTRTKSRCFGKLRLKWKGRCFKCFISCPSSSPSAAHRHRTPKPRASPRAARPAGSARRTEPHGWMWTCWRRWKDTFWAGYRWGTDPTSRIPSRRRPWWRRSRSSTLGKCARTEEWRSRTWTDTARPRTKWRRKLRKSSVSPRQVCVCLQTSVELLGGIMT